MKIVMNMIGMIILSVQAFGAISPAIRVGDILISPSPLQTVENNGEGNATFNLYEVNDVDVPASVNGDVNTEITVDLNKAILKDNDINNVTGEMTQYFNISTINRGKTILFEQKDTIPGDAFGEIRILVEVIKNAFEPTTNKVGLLVNISAITGSAGDGSSYTYTALPEQEAPDYTPTTTVYGGVVEGAGVHNFAFDIKVRELDNGTYDASNPLILTIPKNNALNVLYDASLTTFKGQTVQNSDWSFDDSDSFEYTLTYTGSNFPSGGTSIFGFNGTITVAVGEVGKFLLEATIKRESGGDSNIDNNSDRDTLQKRLP